MTTKLNSFSEVTKLLKGMADVYDVMFHTHLHASDLACDIEHMKSLMKNRDCKKYGWSYVQLWRNGGISEYSHLLKWSDPILVLSVTYDAQTKTYCIVTNKCN